MPLFSGLLVSCKKSQEASTASEIHFALTNELNIAPEKIYARDSRISGLVTVRLDKELDYLQIVRDLKVLDQDAPFFMHCLKIKPIQQTIAADVSLLVDQIRTINIPYTGSYRITVNKRHSTLSSMDVISPLAELFPDTPVNLENPEWEILVEIIADQMGYSVITPDLVLSTQLAHDKSNDEIENWFLS